MAIAHEAHSGALIDGPQSAAVAATPWWERPAVFRYGFVAFILIVWQLVAPFISPIFFTSPSADRGRLL